MRALFGAAFLLSLLAAPAAAADPDTLFKIRRAGTIAIGYSEAATPFSFLGPDGKPAGYSIDLCREIAAGVQRDLNLSKLEIKWVKLPPDARISAVVSGRVDIECGSTTRTLSREAFALDHGHAEPALGKKGGGRASRGAAAHHDDVDVTARGHGIGECALIRSRHRGSHSTAWRASGASAKQRAVP